MIEKTNSDARWLWMYRCFNVLRFKIHYWGLFFLNVRENFTSFVIVTKRIHMELNQRIKEKMIEKDIRPSVPRTKIYKYLLEHRNHPTVDTIYKGLQSELTSLSKTTVYNTLSLLTAKGLVRAIGIEDKELRYDADIHTHGHFKCVKCHAIFDFELDLESIDLKGLSEFVAEDYHLNIKGVCRTCKKA